MRILAASSPGEIRIAVMDGDTLENYAIWRPGAPDGLGDLHIGRITAVVPAMAGAFVTLADTEGFLPNSEGAAGRTEGEYLSVRITRTTQGGKGPRLTAAPHATAEGPPRLLEPGPSPLARLAAAYPNATILTDDAALFAGLRAQHPDRLTLAPRAFDDAVEEQIDGLSSPVAHLPGGLLATITPTPALIAIDLDGAASTAERGEKRTLQFAANRAAIPALVRQIRLRNLSGAILIDLAGIPIKRRPALAPDLAACLAADPARPRLLGFTQLGLAEITRPRHAPPLHELLAGPLAAGLAALREAARNPTRRTRLRAAPAVVSALQADAHALPDLARRTTHPLSLRSDPALPPNHWVIEDQT
jgi:Ribonuclease G/E